MFHKDALVHCVESEFRSQLLPPVATASPSCRCMVLHQSLNIVFDELTYCVG